MQHHRAIIRLRFSVGSSELPDASSSSADAMAEEDLLALVATRVPGEFRGVWVAVRGGRAPQHGDMQS